MVYRRNDDDTAGWHEPPYTEEEEIELARTGPGPWKTNWSPNRPHGSAPQRPVPRSHPTPEEK
jgi:hypothetical protein